ncbi:tyrosine--tRNA ligase, cytoplasmic-like, partial [Olea europaea subsp. europaea]
MENNSETPPSEPLQHLSICPESSSQMSLDERFEIIRSIGEECIQEDELKRLLANKRQPICYDGFEPSGRMHIAQ